MSRSLAITARDQLLRTADRLPAVRRLMTDVLARHARRRGADEHIVDLAVTGADDREAKRTAEMIRWARAVAGSAGFPRWFPAAHHITSTAGRRTSAVALRSFLEAHPDTGEYLWRQLFAFESNPDLDELREFVSSDLTKRLDATPPVDAPGVERRDPPQIDVLRSVVQILAGLGAKPFLVSGTLLGHVRDGRLLSHDYDIDLGLMPDDGDPVALSAALAEAGFDVAADETKIVCRTPDDGAAVDIFLHYERDGRLWHGTAIHEWWNTPFTLDEIEFMGVRVWSPSDPARYLTENYGDWSRRVSFYNFSFDTPNRVYRQSPEALLYLHKRFVRAMEHGDRWTAESCARELRDGFDVDVTDFFNPTPLVRPLSND